MRAAANLDALTVKLGWWADLALTFDHQGSGKGTLSQKVLDTYPDVNLVRRSLAEVHTSGSF